MQIQEAKGEGKGLSRGGIIRRKNELIRKM